MPEQAPHLRVVGPGERPRPRRPGPAVLSVLAYAVLFGGALWYLRTKSPLFNRKTPAREDPPTASVSHAPRSGPQAPSQRDKPGLSRGQLLAGETLAGPALAEYFRHLASDRCDCGCGRTLSDCLANEKSCTHSPRLADEIRRSNLRP